MASEKELDDLALNIEEELRALEAVRHSHKAARPRLQDLEASVWQACCLTCQR